MLRLGSDSASALYVNSENALESITYKIYLFWHVIDYKAVKGFPFLIPDTLLDVFRDNERCPVSAIALAQQEIGLFVILDQLCHRVEMECSPEAIRSVRQVR